tara:strand:+ start:691 stop:870 length:180 start_codon:yes stop_codon:yes gene_type:complete
MDTTKLTKETRFYYLDYLQKKLNRAVASQNQKVHQVFSLSALDNMLYMIMELKKEEQEG